MNILMPLTITDAMLTSASVAEPAASETTWVSGGTHVIGDKRIRTGVHREFRCILGHTGRTEYPEVDDLYWEDYGPTLKWAPFDTYVSTPATGTSPMSYVLSPGFMDAISLYGLVGSSLTLTVKDGPAGATLDTRTYSLYEESAGLYEYLFAPARPKEKIIATGFPLYPTAQVTLTLTGPSAVALGMYNLGQYRTIINSDWGGTEYGASVEPVTYSRIKINADTGATTIKRGAAASGMRATVVLPLADANFALQSIQQVLDVPVSWVVNNLANYAGLNVFGLGSASMIYAGPGHVQLNINVKGMI